MKIRTPLPLKVQKAGKFIVPIIIPRQSQIMKTSVFIMTMFSTEKNLNKYTIELPEVID